MSGAEGIDVTDQFATGSVVERLFFGRDDAENDFADGLLRQVFLQTKASKEASSGRKNLIIGRKGSGKSAICMWLAGAPENVGWAQLIAPDDAAGDEIRRFELAGLTGETSKSLIWRYVFAVQAARHLTSHADIAHSAKKLSSVKALRRFLQKNNEAGEERFYDRVVRAGRTLETSLSLEAFGVKAAVDYKSSTEGARAAQQLEVLEGAVTRAFTDLGCSEQCRPFLVLVDQLEQVWSPDQESEQLVTGLLLAGKRAARLYGGALRCIIFMRADIYDSLSFMDADKFHSDEMRIDWTSSKLRELARLRAETSLRSPLSDADLWGNVFPSKVLSEKTADYLFSRAFPRPRDVIQFLNLCRDMASYRDHTTISERDVVDATLEFSQWKLLDLAKEYQLVYPFLDRLFAMFQSAGYVVMRSAVATKFAVFEQKLREEFPQYAAGLTSDGVVEILFGVGFLGARRGDETVYVGTAHLPIQPEEREFRVHPCFRAALNSLKPTNIERFNGSRLLGINVGIASGGNVVGNVFAGHDIGTAPSRDFALLDALLTACNRIARQLPRAGLPAEARQQVSDEIGRVMSDGVRARDQLNSNQSVDVVQHVVRAAGYLNLVAEQLNESGIDSTARSGGIAYRIRDEARNLLDEVGGGRRKPS